MAYVGTSYITYPKRDDTTLMSTAKKEKGDPLVMTNLLYAQRRMWAGTTCGEHRFNLTQ